MTRPYLHTIATIMFSLALLAGGETDCHAQLFKKKKAKTEVKKNITPEQIITKPQEQQSQGLMEFIVEGNDTIYIDEIRASKVYSRLPRQKGKDWRKYYRLVHNFSKTYPYALVAKKIVARADSTIAADNLKRAKRDKYISLVQKELFNVFEKPLRGLTVTQGALLMKLIDREIGKSSYDIIKDSKNGIAAKFWNGIAKMFGSDLRKPYDPEGEDKMVEDLVKLWEDGDFPAFYMSLFWQDPPIVEIPEEYR